MLCSDFQRRLCLCANLAHHKLTGALPHCIAPNLQGRTSANYVGCLVRQLTGTVPNAESEAVAFTDSIGVVL